VSSPTRDASPAAGTADRAARPGRPTLTAEPAGDTGAAVLSGLTPESRLDLAREIAGGVPDPELPMVTLDDLGILRDVVAEGARIVVFLTPTYSGCPALREMRQDVSRQLAAAGFAEVETRTALSPPWSSDWITAPGRRKLAAAGIAPPGRAPRRADGPVPLTLTVGRADVTCPSCGSPDTELTAAFGATACKDLYRCRACREPFEHVKEI
jgi:ring-1,2-phenylacetyl-CoA epoxidase subunit PaaD